MDDLFAGIEELTFRQRARRQAELDLFLDQQGVFDTKPKRRNSKSSGKPRTGGKPKTGAAPIDPSLEADWRKRRPAKSAGGGGGAGRGRSGSASSSGAPAKTLPAANEGATGFAPAKDSIPVKMALASGAQAAVVKVASYAGGGSRIGSLVQYQSHDGELALEREDGSLVQGSEQLAGLGREWADESPEREPTKDVLRVSLTLEGERYLGRAGQGAIETALQDALPGHRYAWRVEDIGNGATRVELVMSAAARRQGEAKAVRIFDNRKSLAHQEQRLDRAFGTGTDIEMHGFAHGVEGAARYLTRLTRGGTLPAQTARLANDGSFAGSATLAGHDANLEEAKNWKRDLRSQEQRDVAHIILSARPGTDREAFLDAARETLAREFAGHQYAFTLHTNRDHIHVHAVVKMKAETGERLDPNINDLKRWRETLAQEARERHIPMQAASRFERANPPGYKLKDIRRVERGAAPEPVRRRVDAVKTGAVHVPTREEGKQRAVAVAQGWREVEAIAATRMPQPVLADGAVRLYRADRPGAAMTSAPLFTRDREAAVRMAARTGGSVSYVDVSPSQLSALKRSRNDPVNQFVVSAELAAARKPLETAASATILQFRQRAETAVAGALHQQRTHTETQPEESNTMARLETMKAAFDDMNAQFDIVEKNLPPERAPELAVLRKKLEHNQRAMLGAQENIERKRGAVEGDTYVEPKPKQLGNYIAEERGETVRYARRDETGEVGKLAFVDTGKKVEIHDWKDREAVLAAMQVSAEKWGSLTVTGTDKYKTMVVELAVEHGFRIANPELQDKLAAETTRLNRERAARPGFTDGEPEKQEQSLPTQTTAQEDVATQAPPSPTTTEVPPQKRPSGQSLAVDQVLIPTASHTEAEINIALDTVSAKTEAEAVRETKQADESTRTHETLIEGGGSDHAYRTEAEAGAARRAEKAVELDPNQPIPADINQSPQVECLAQEQAELLKEKNENEKAETQKKVHRQRQ